MKKFPLLFIVVFCISYLASAQSIPPIQWKQCYGTAAYNERIQGIDTAHGSGYIFCSTGACTGTNFGDFLVVKTDSLGQILWQKCYDNQGWNDGAYDIIATDDGGYIVVGQSMTPLGSNSDVWIIKIDNNGNLLWQKKLGGSLRESALSIVKMADGNYIVAANTESNDGDVIGSRGMGDIWLIKITSSGNVLWKKAFGDSQLNHLRTFTITPDGNHVLIASGVSVADGDVLKAYTGSGWLAKISTTGNLVWQHTIGDSVTQITILVTMETKNGDYLVALENRYTAPYGGYELMRIDATGNVLWHQLKDNTTMIFPNRIYQVSDSDFVIAGHRIGGGITDNDNSLNYYLERINASGNKIWSKVYGGTNREQLFDFLYLPDGSYLLAGFAKSSDYDVTGHLGMEDGWIVKLRPDPLTSVAATPLRPSYIHFYPNPATASISFSEKTTVKIINQQGQVVKQEKNVSELNVEELSSGMYFIFFTDANGNTIQVEKLIKE